MKPFDFGFPGTQMMRIENSSLDLAKGSKRKRKAVGLKIEIHEIHEIHQNLRNPVSILIQFNPLQQNPLLEVKII